MKKIHLLLVLAGLVAGYVLSNAGREAGPASAADSAVAEASEYTCSMHPQIRQPGPGLCPICAMDLIPVAGAGSTDPGPRAIALSPAAMELARIETAPVIRGEASATLPLAGVLSYDATRTRDVALLAEGQIRKLHANVTGMQVREGDRLADIYSPQVFAAARELVAARGNEILIEAARQKLRLYGVGETEINEIIHSGRAIDTYSVTSPIDGAVISVRGNQGMWLMLGDVLATIGDTSTLWAEFDVYEKDIGLVHMQDPVEITLDAFPGESFAGVISFLPAAIDPATRSLKARADVSNPGLRLKEGMFIRAGLKVSTGKEQLLIPATAVLRTGRRAVVYVQSDKDPGTFEGRVVTCGPMAGEQQVIIDGLVEGERVVIRGAMRIDSSLQLMAKPSMMSLPGSDTPAAKRPQTHCPIAGGEIERDVFIDYGGYRIYFCCPGCDEDFLADAEKYISKMRAEGIELEQTPADVIDHRSH